MMGATLQLRSEFARICSELPEVDCPARDGETVVVWRFLDTTLQLLIDPDARLEEEKLGALWS